MLPFLPYPPTTEEENDDEIARLDLEIAAASKRRQYVRAAALQQSLDYCHQVRQYYVEHPDEEARRNKIRSINTQQEEEQVQMMNHYCAQLDTFLEEAYRRLSEIEEDHENELADVDIKVADPRFSALRISPTIQAMVRGEQFYAKHRSYKLANGFRNEATMRTRTEIERLESACDQTTEARVRAIETEYIQRKVALQAKMEMDVLRLKKDARWHLLSLQHKYTKLRSRWLRDRDFDIPPPNEGKCIYEALDQRYADFVTALGFAPQPPSQTPSPKSIKLPSRPSYTARSPRITRALTKTSGRRTLARTI
jgi:hypothetical protein